MSRNRPLALAALALVLGLVAHSASAADGRGPRHGGRHGGPRSGMRHDYGHPMGHRLLSGLDLTDSQKAQLVDVLTDNYRNSLVARMELADARQAVRDLADADAPDADAVVQANEALGAAKGKLDVLARQAADSVQSVLTPEQQAELDAWRDRGDRDDGEWSGPRRRHGDGYGPRGGHRGGFRGGWCR